MALGSSSFLLPCPEAQPSLQNDQSTIISHPKSACPMEDACRSSEARPKPALAMESWLCSLSFPLHPSAGMACVMLTVLRMHMEIPGRGLDGGGVQPDCLFSCQGRCTSLSMVAVALGSLFWQIGISCT